MTETDPLLPAGTKLCIVKPNVGLSTPSVFKALDYDELSTLDADEVLLPSFLKDFESVPAEHYINDLEAPAFRCVPQLGKLKGELEKVKGFKHVMMSGSGTSIFCLGHPEDEDAFLQQFDSRDDLLVFFTSFINRPDNQWFTKPDK